MGWIRGVSLVRRVTLGLGCCAAIIAAIGGGAVWALQGAAGAPPNAVLALGIATVAGCLFAIASAWVIRGSIRDSVEPTV